MKQVERLENLSKVLAESGRVRLAILFGSQATGRARPDSDVDIGIVPSAELSLAEELSLAQALEEVVRSPVDLVRLDRGDALCWVLFPLPASGYSVMIVELVELLFESALQFVCCTIQRLIYVAAMVRHDRRRAPLYAGFHCATLIIPATLVAILVAQMDFHPSDA